MYIFSRITKKFERINNDVPACALIRYTYVVRSPLDINSLFLLINSS